MRIAHRNCADLYVTTGCLQRIPIRWQGCVEGQRSRIEVGNSHVDRYLAVAADGRVHQPADTVHMNLSAETALAAYEPRDAARAVAALFDFGTIRVEDPVKNIGTRTPRGLEHQGLIEPDAGAAICQTAIDRCWNHRGRRRLENDEIISEAVHFSESKMHACSIADSDGAQRW